LNFHTENLKYIISYSVLSTYFQWET